jgi:acetyltransferase
MGMAVQEAIIALSMRLPAHHNRCCPARPFCTRDMRALPANPALQRYLAELTERWHTSAGIEVTIRAIRPGDADIEQEFVRVLSAATRFQRFFDTIKELSPAQLLRFTRIDFSHEMALIAVHFQAGREIEIAVARYVTNAGGRSCEFAIVVADDWRRHGLATKLMHKLMACACAAGLEVMEGEVLANNDAMLGLVKGMGFTLRPSPNDPTLRSVAYRLLPVPANRS